jgi:hypothetical protein
MCKTQAKRFVKRQIVSMVSLFRETEINRFGNNLSFTLSVHISGALVGD